MELSYSIGSSHDGPSNSCELGGYPTGFALAATYANASNSISIVAPAAGSEARVQIRERGLANDGNCTYLTCLVIPLHTPSTTVDRANFPLPFITADKQHHTGDMVPFLAPHPKGGHLNIRDAPGDPTWPGQPTNLGLTVNTDGSNTVFYVGTDRALHSIQLGVNQAVTTSNAPPASAWPIADQENAPFAVTSNQDGNIFIYYQAGGLVREIRFADGAWLSATPVETDTAATSTTQWLWACQTAATGASNDTSTSPSAPPANTATSTATTSTAAADDNECGTACAERAQPWAIALSTVLVAFVVVVVGVVCYFRRRSRTAQRAIVDERERDAAWLPCQSPSLDNIQPYSSLGGLRWEEKRRNVEGAESQSPSSSRGQGLPDELPRGDLTAQHGPDLPPAEQEVRPEDIGIAL